MEKCSTGLLSIEEQEFQDTLPEINQSQKIPVAMNPSDQLEAGVSINWKKTVGERMVAQCSASGPQFLSSHPSSEDDGCHVEVHRTLSDTAMDSAAAEADFGFTWLDETSKEYSPIVTWPTDQREDDDFHEAPPSTNMLMGENDPMWCGAIVRSPPPTVEGCATFSLPTKEDIASKASHTIMNCGKPSAGMKIDCFADSVVKDLFEDLTWTNYAWEDAEKTPTHLPLKTDLDLRMYPESAYKPKEETDFEHSLKMRDAQPDCDSSKTNVVFPKRKPLMDHSNLLETQSHTDTVKPRRKRRARSILLKRIKNTSALKRQSEKFPPMKLRHSSRKKPNHPSSAPKPATRTQRAKQDRMLWQDARQRESACASTSASKMNSPGGILTRDLNTKSTETLNQEEKKKMLESIEQARALLLTLMFQDGTTQLQSEQSPPNLTLSVSGLLLLLINDVDSCHRGHSLSQNDLLLYHQLACSSVQVEQQIFTRDLLQQMLSRAGVTVCYRAKDLLSVTLQLCRPHFSWKQVSGCRFQDPHVSGWFLDPEDPCTCYRDLHWKHTHKNLPPATPATVLSELYSLYYLNKKLCAEIQWQGLWKTYCDIELKMIPVLAAMESQCFQMDKDALESQSDLLKTKMNQLEEDAHRAAGEYFLITSTIQIRQVLFEKLRLHERLNKKMLPQYMATREDTASSHTLQMYQDVHPLPKIILEYREVEKTRTNFVDNTYVYMMMKGFISPNWSQTSDVMGRIFSANPNFDTIPLKITLMPHAKGGELDVMSFNPREVYISEEGWTFVAAGFCQLELRLLAHFSGDDKLINLFTNTDSDVYAVLASEWLRKHAVTSEEIEQAKRIVSSILYGKGRDCLANTMGVTLPEARRFQDNFFLKFPKVKDFILMTTQQCREHAFACSLTGRRRPLRHILSKDTALRSPSEKKAVAFVLQGSVADLCKMAMIQVSELLCTSETLSARLMAHFSDELLFEVEQAQVEEFAALVKRSMESLSHSHHLGVHLNVPLKVAVSCGKSWGSMAALHMPPA
ncbi:DNA polymerase nu isoform X2 [Hippocampus zosterae]|uniref:DNA polymerase nu isoform X2 n=1 Tax=Hippocampus zosterae TaxID=109293 RepID=UPI00223E3637|nr:DNA polymerase nu isoform X2 [Hippocampus zosterae]